MSIIFAVILWILLTSIIWSLILHRRDKNSYQPGFTAGLLSGQQLVLKDDMIDRYIERSKNSHNTIAYSDGSFYACTHDEDHPGPCPMVLIIPTNLAGR